MKIKCKIVDDCCEIDIKKLYHTLNEFDIQENFSVTEIKGKRKDGKLILGKTIKKGQCE
jgi:hypothetical protein